MKKWTGPPHLKALAGRPLPPFQVRQTGKGEEGGPSLSLYYSPFMYGILPQIVRSHCLTLKVSIYINWPIMSASALFVAVVLYI